MRPSAATLDFAIFRKLLVVLQQEVVIAAAAAASSIRSTTTTRTSARFLNPSGIRTDGHRFRMMKMIMLLFCLWLTHRRFLFLDFFEPCFFFYELFFQVCRVQVVPRDADDNIAFYIFLRMMMRRRRRVLVLVWVEE